MRWWILIALTSINLLNYIDRYIFSALLPAIKNDLGFTDTQLGLLGSGFIVAYLFISPVFGYLGDHKSRAKIMGIGLLLWSGATAFSGLTVSFFGQMLTRITVGAGESAYSVIAPTLISDCFPRTSRGKIFAIYSGAIPVGSALGYLLGGLLEPAFGWRHAFFVVGVPGVLIAIFLFFMKEPKRGAQETNSLSATKPSIVTVYKKLFGNGGFMMTVLGYAAYTFVVGGMAFWMPSYIVRYFAVSLEKGNLIFGGVTVAGGVLGTLLGGYWADYLERTQGNGYLKVSVYSTLLAVPLFIFMLHMKTFASFAAVLFAMEVAVFLCISPLDAAVINFVRPEFRATAMALNIFLIHLLGDGISRSLMGVISDADGLQSAIGLLPWFLALGGMFWASGVVFFWQSVPLAETSFQIPERQAHRGYVFDGKNVENTLSAFQAAKESGALMVECDIRLSRDGEVVIFHDDDLVRIGKQKDLVAELDLNELRRLVNVTTLRDLLNDPLSPTLVNIELKSATVTDHGLERAAIEVVRETKSSDRVLFSSFNPFSLRRMAKLAPDLLRALLVTARPEKKNRIWFRRMWLAFWARPHLLHADDWMITPKRMESWLERGIPVIVWTVNDTARAEELLAMGARSIITDQLLTSKLAT